jgi:hypothetical protein
MLVKRLVVLGAAAWAGARVLAHRRARRERLDQPVPTGGDGYQTEPPTPRD